MAVSSRRISIKWKLFGFVALLISSAIFIIVFRTTNIFRYDKEAFVKELSAKLASSTSKNFLNRVTSLQDKLVIFISSRESLSHTGARTDDQVQVLFSRYQEFLSIGFMSSDENGKLKPEWVMRNPQDLATKWPADYEKTFLVNLNTKDATTNGRALWRAQAPDGSWLSVIGFSVQFSDVKQAKKQATSSTAWIVGILPTSAFDDLLNDFSTGLNTGLVVDDQGVAIANSDMSNRGKNLKTHPLVKEALKNDRPAETGDYTDLNGRAIIGSFEYIPQMNLVAIVTTPRDKAFEAADTMSHDIFLIGLLLLVIALGAAIILSNYLTGPIQKLAAIAAKIGGGDFKTPIDVVTNDEIGELAESFKIMESGLMERDEKINMAQIQLVKSEKMSAFGQLSAGIAHEVKNPLAGILGHAQLAIGKITDENVKKHLEVIEKETRRCKQIVENLMKFARAEKAQLVPTDLAQACQDTINLVDHQLTLAGCKIYKDFQPCPMVEANANMLQQVLLNLMVNSSHAMETCATKNVTVRVLQVGKKAQIQVEDTGTGISPEVQKKMFEPFFTTKPAGKGTGLGLSVSVGIVREHKGEIYTKSEMGKGTTFFIDIPIAEGAQMPTKPLENTHGGVAVASQKGSPHQPPTVKTPPPAAPVQTVLVKTEPTKGIGNIESPKTEQAKVLNIKDVKKSDLPQGLPRAAATTLTPPLPEDADNPGIPSLKEKVVAGSSQKIPGNEKSKTEKPKTEISKTEIPKAEKPKTERPKASPTSTSKEINELGGKRPVDITLVNLPKHPDEAEPLEMETMGRSQTVTQAPTEKTRVEVSGVSDKVVATRSVKTETEFKVKVTRPKLKG